MTEIKQANIENAPVLALLGRKTYVESHGHFIYNESDLKQYLDTAFSLSKAKAELSDPNVLIYFIYVGQTPVGYTKLVINDPGKNNSALSSCQLERIYIIKEFLGAQIGQRLFNFVLQKARDLKRDIIWLSVYIKNERAIKFYKRNGFEQTGELDFDVAGKPYKNYVLSKNLVQ